jgi:glycosyltransferase involved in cell wall biosynthesis
MGIAGFAMKISIVTLSFNQRSFLQEAIESVLKQGYDELEYIVVDPGSTDGSRELIRSYGSKIAVTVFEPDRGAADGLNKGFLRATGEVLGFLNADDSLLPDALRDVAAQFASRPEIDIVMGNGYIVNSMGGRMKHVHARQFTVCRYLYGGCRWLQQATFFRRSALALTEGFNVENRTCWDGELVLSMAVQGACIGYMNQDLANFRIHATSISGSGRNQTQYRSDSRRLFRYAMGRDWQLWDEAVRAYFRLEGFLKDRMLPRQTGAQ